MDESQPQINPALIKLVGVIQSNPQKYSHLKNCKNFNEYYNNCLKIVDGYTENEFKTFFNNMASLGKKGVCLNFKDLNNINDEELSNVSGGILREKFIAAKNRFETATSGNAAPKYVYDLKTDLGTYHEGLRTGVKMVNLINFMFSEEAMNMTDAERLDYVNRAMGIYGN